MLNKNHILISALLAAFHPLCGLSESFLALALLGVAELAFRA